VEERQWRTRCRVEERQLGEWVQGGGEAVEDEVQGRGEAVADLVTVAVVLGHRPPCSAAPCKAGRVREGWRVSRPVIAFCPMRVSIWRLLSPRTATASAVLSGTVSSLYMEKIQGKILAGKIAKAGGFWWKISERQTGRYGSSPPPANTGSSGPAAQWMDGDVTTYGAQLVRRGAGNFIRRILLLRSAGVAVLRTMHISHNHGRF
jgi:hypothetical protein